MHVAAQLGDSDRGRLSCVSHQRPSRKNEDQRASEVRTLNLALLSANVDGVDVAFVRNKTIAC